MSLIHWNYFLAIEQSVEELSRFIEFHSDNFETYSIEVSRILMSATQENDVLLKQICAHFGNQSKNEAGYRNFFPTKYPKLCDIEIEIPRYELMFKPFINWKTGQTPVWWTANNKVKHERHANFNKASLQNMLMATCALYIINIYYYLEVLQNEEIYPGSKLFAADDTIKSMSPTIFGMMPNYKLP
jgi:hypothetical protein